MHVKLKLFVGVTISLPGRGMVTCCTALVYITCDMPAKAQVLNITNIMAFIAAITVNKKVYSF